MNSGKRRMGTGGYFIVGGIRQWFNASDPTATTMEHMGLVRSSAA